MPIKALITLLCGLIVTSGVRADTTITGASGLEATFAAVFEATPKGLLVLRNPEDAAMEIPWDKIDLNKLKAANAQIYSAYELAVAKQANQPLELGLASSILTLSQVKEAVIQALKDPYVWPWNYSSGTLIVGGRRSIAIIHPADFAISPIVALRRLVDAVDDRSKQAALEQFKLQSYYNSCGIEAMLGRLDDVMSRLPTERMFPRQPRDNILIQNLDQFRKRIRAINQALVLSGDDQRAITEFLKQLGL